MVENHITANGPWGYGAPRIFVLGTFIQNFARALQTGQRFGDLRADAHDLKYRRHQETEKQRVGDESAQGHDSGKNLAGSDVHYRGADDPDHGRGGKSHHRHRRQALEHVIEQALHTAGENLRLARFGVVALHYAHASQ